MNKKVFPWLGTLESFHEVANVEIRWDKCCFDLRPIERSRNGRSCETANRGRSHDRLAEAVAKGIKIDTSMPCSNRMLNRQLSRVRSRHARDNGFGEQENIICIGSIMDEYPSLRDWSCLSMGRPHLSQAFSRLAPENGSSHLAVCIMGWIPSRRTGIGRIIRAGEEVPYMPEGNVSAGSPSLSSATGSNGSTALVRSK